MFGMLGFNYKGRNGHWYQKLNTTAAEIRRIYKRTKPTTFNVWFYTDEGFVIYWNIDNHGSLQARSITFVGDVATRYNGRTEILYPYNESTSC